jgi:hypothetical protein
MDEKLKKIIDNSPSVIRNSIGIRIVKLIAWVFGSLLFFVGFALLVSGLVSGVLIKNIMPDVFVIELQDNQAVWNTFSMLLGLTGIILGVMMLFTVKLSKMVLVRNAFIFDLFGWQLDYEKKEKARAKEMLEKERITK